MIEVVPGSGVFWYATNKSYVQGSAKNATQLTSSCMEVFFSRDVLRRSNFKGGGTKYERLNKDIVAAIQSWYLIL